MRTILLKLAGPLQSWGTDSSFETRMTDFYPSKSAAIGMIAASLGYCREQDEDIRRLNELDFAVRIDQQGNLLRDYHIAQKYKPKGDFDRTYVTNRYYLEDAVFLVAIGHQDKAYLSMILEALKNPYFQPYLGRRSLPLLADFLLDTSDLEPLEALEQTPWLGSGSTSNRHESQLNLPIYADQDLLRAKNVRMRKDRVESFSQRHRRYGFRAEGHSFVTVENPHFVVEKMDDHDVFACLGGD